MPQGEQALVRVQDGRWIFEFGGDVDSFVAGRDGQPRYAARETGVGAVIPLHGRALAVSSFFLRPTYAANRILHIFLTRGIVVLHSNFFAVIHDWCAAKSQIKGPHQFSYSLIVLPVPVTHVRSHDVVIA